MITLEIQDDRMQARMREIQHVLIAKGRNGDAAKVMAKQARLFLKQVITLTPPRGLSGSARKQGEQAVARDLSKIFTPVADELLNLIGSQHGVSGIDAWFETSQGEPKHIEWDRIDPSGSGMKAWHEKNRDSRGRTRSLKRRRDSWYAPYVVSFEDFSNYAAKIKSHVGRRKAAWALSFQKLGGSVQQWIGRNVSGAMGRFVDNLGTINRPSVTMVNSSPGISGDEHIARSAMRVRYQAMGRELKLIISGYAADVKRGLRVTNKVREEPVESI